MRSGRPALKRASAIGDLLIDLLRRQGLESKVKECRAWLAWDDAVGPQIAAHARPVRVRDGVLEVRVDQPVWMQQLQLLKPKILAKLNDRPGPPALRDIFWRRGRLEKEPAMAAEVELLWRSVILSPEEEERIDEAVAGIGDPELRRGLHEILLRQLRLEKARQVKS